MLLTTATAVVAGAPAEARAGRFAGTCLITLEVEVSPSPALVPVDYAEIKVTDPGYNKCYVAPDLAWVDVTVSTATSNPMETHPAAGVWSCLAGLAAGRLEFSVTADDFDPMTVDATIVNVGGTVHMVLTALPVAFEGVGTLVQHPLDTAACAQGTMGKATWIGVLTFQA